MTHRLLCPGCGHLIEAEPHEYAEEAVRWAMQLHVAQCESVQEALEDAVERILAD